MRNQSYKQRPELHVTPETGVLEAPAGAVISHGTMHIFHQFRPHTDQGARWAHQIASNIAYDWDVCDDVLAPEGDEVDILAGSSVPLEDNKVELFFVSTHAPEGLEDETDKTAFLGSHIDHRLRGDRRFTIERAAINDISDLVDASDDPETPDARVQRLGPITVDDSAYPVEALVTPSVIHDPSADASENTWLMLALNLEDNEHARIIVLRSADRQHWRTIGPLEFSTQEALPTGRPFAPRVITMIDRGNGELRTVLLLTYQDHGDREIAGYIVGDLIDNTFHVATPFTPIDYGHSFTRPRVMQYDPPVMFGLVGATPKTDEQWANCLSSPRYLTLLDGILYQDLIGAPRAVKGISDRGLLWTGQLDASQGDITAEITNERNEVIARVVYSNDHIVLSTIEDGESRYAPLAEADSDTLTIFIDGPVCEIFADGGAVTLTSTIAADSPVQGIHIEAADGTVIASLVSLGQDLQRLRAGIDSDEAQEELIAQALIADRELAEEPAE